MATAKINVIFSRKIKSICTCCYRSTALRLYSTDASEKPTEKINPYVVFNTPPVQRILKALTGFDPDKTFHKQKARVAKRPSYKALSENELEEEMRKAKWREEVRLQMPPYLPERKPREKIISSDPDIAPAISTKMVFVDISWRTKRIRNYRNRPIVVRHKNGDLAVADWETTDRVLQIFDPQKSRDVFPPKMFEEKHLENILSPDKYEYILQRACVQFEPDSAEFKRVTERVFDEIAKKHQYKVLHCTRFYGPMVFYLCLGNRADPLLIDLLERGLLDEAGHLIDLRRILNQREPVADDLLNKIPDYIENECNPKYKATLEETLSMLKKKLKSSEQQSGTTS